MRLMFASLFILVLAHHSLLAAEPLTIKAITGLQYDVKRFAVEPGATVTILFVNDDATDMPHNLVFTKPGETHGCRQCISQSGC